MRGVSCFVDGLAQGRMRVDGRDDFLVRRFERNGEAKFGDHLRRICANDVRAEDFAVRFADEEFNKSFAFADRQGLATGEERELANLILEPLFFRSTLGQTDAGDLRLAVGAAGKDGHLLWLGHSEHPLDRLNRLEARHMRQPRRPDDISGSIDPLDVRLVIVVDLYPAFLICVQL